MHKILKDATRQRIVQLLSEKGSLTYTELMSTLGITSTGTLNYHLKILSDLLTKTEDAKYTLTEKGKLAARLLLEFPGKSQAQIEAELPRSLLMGMGLVAGVYFIIVTALYFMEYLDFASMVTSIFLEAAAVVLLFVSNKVRKRRSEWFPNRQIIAAEISIIFAGAVGGVWAGFFGGGLLLRASLGVMVLNASNSNLKALYGFTFWVLNPILGATLGAFVGYLIYKRSKYSKIGYYDPFE